MCRLRQMAELRKVFVYGTLKRGEANHSYLTTAENGFSKFVSKGVTNVRLPLIIATRYNIPFLLDKPGHGSYVTGEIYEVDDKMFEKLDILEDYKNLYDRQVQDISAGIEGGNVPCWVYLLRKYPEYLLKLPTLSVYKSTAEKPYQERSKRVANISAKDDLMSAVN